MTLSGTQFPRLLAGLSAEAALDLSAHEALHGAMVLQGPGRGRGRGGGHPLILELERAGLRGHGGAGFPTATKLAAVAARGSAARGSSARGSSARGSRPAAVARGSGPTVVVNASEGEPLSRKDALLVRRVPHLVLDGAIAAATTLGADRIVIALDEHARGAAQALSHALSERAELSARGAPSVELAPVPWGYLTGQETALVNVLSGGPPKPTLRPPYMFERGLKGRPTLICNAETYAHIGLVARHGADWYRELGSRSAPGTRLVTVGGAVSYPGVVEIAGGTTLGRLIEASGGLTEPLGGVLLGGYAGTWLAPDALELVLDEQALHQRGIRLGAGIVFILPGSACVVSEVARVAAWLLAQSAHQCGPCEHGLGAIVAALSELTASAGLRAGRLEGYRQIERWCGLVIGRGACALPDGAAGFVSSALHAFRPAFEDHARHGECEACHSAKLLPTAPARSALRT